jgi:ELWxxDGT repeat protein
VTGTIMTRDIYTGSNYSYPATSPGRSLLLPGLRRATGTELWRSDGTLTGTVRVADINPGLGDAYPSGMTLFGAALYYSADDGVNGRELWRTTFTTTQLVTNLNPLGSGNIGDLLVHNSDLYFTADDGVNGMELWRFDGTTATRLTDINPGAGSANPSGLWHQRQ